MYTCVESSQNFSPPEERAHKSSSCGCCGCCCCCCRRRPAAAAAARAAGTQSCGGTCPGSILGTTWSKWNGKTGSKWLFTAKFIFFNNLVFWVFQHWQRGGRAPSARHHVGHGRRRGGGGAGGVVQVAAVITVQGTVEKKNKKNAIFTGENMFKP